LFAILLNEGRLSDHARKCGVEVKVIPESQNSFLEILQEATVYIRSRQIRVLHSHRYKENLLTALLAWRCDVPFVVRTQHGLPEPFEGFRLLKHGVLHQLDRFVARYATDRVISVSAELRDHLTQYLRPDKIAVIPNGLDPGSARSDLSVNEAKRRLNIPEDCLVVGSAGRLEPVKRLDIFLAAAEGIATRIQKSRFVILGDGREGQRLRQIALEKGLVNRVLFLGHRNDAQDVLRAFDVFILCSDHEGIPMILLEALQLGVPVVARRVGGIPEVLRNGMSGILVDSGEPQALADASLRLLQDGELRKRLAQAGSARVAEDFSASRTAANVADLYLSMCATQ
jgi:glycosyltransferase involved in cell wall biosynthesis